MDDLLHLATQLADQSTTPLFAPVQGRVAYVVSHGQSYASNGYAIRTQGIAKALNQHGLDTLCFVRPGRPWELGVAPGSVGPETEVAGVRYLHSPWASGKTPGSEREHLEASVERFIQLFRVYRPAAVLAGSNWIVGLPAWVAAKRLGLPFYNEVRGFWELSREAREPGYANTPAYQAERERDIFVAKQARKVVTLNQPMKAELVKRGVAAESIELVPNGIDELPPAKSADPALKQKLGIQPGDKVVGYVGSFSAYEGLDVLLQACAELVQQGEKLKLLLVGDDQPVTQAAGTNKALADTPWLTQVGRVPHEQVADYYALLDAVVIPRKSLPVCELVPPLKAAEALAYGKRLVVSNIAPLKEYADKHDGVTTFTPESPESLAEVLQQSLKLPAPKPSAELLFSAHAEPLTRALKGEEQKKGGESEAVAKPVPAESPKKAENFQPHLGVLNHPETIELRQKDPIWHSVSVQAGQDLIIEAASEYHNVKGAKNRKAVLLLNGLDAEGNRVDKPLGRMAKSGHLKAYFKYLPCTQNQIQELHGFTVPDDVSEIRVGVCGFHKQEGEKVTLRELRVKPKAAATKGIAILPAAVDSQKPEFLPKSEKNNIEELGEKIIWESFYLSEGEVLSLSGELVGEGVKGRKTVLLVEAKSTTGEELDLATYGYLWSGSFNHWFKYLYPNETNGKFFELKSDDGEIKISTSLIKFGCRDGEKIFIKNKKVEKTTSSSIEESLQRFLLSHPSLMDVENLLYADITLNVIDGSSIWLSSMAKILASQQKTILVLKEDVRNFQIFDSLKSFGNLVIIQPSDFLGEGAITLDVMQSIQGLRVIDNYLPSIKNVVIRGLSAAVELHRTRQFKYRSFIYLTDFYSYENGLLKITSEQEISVKQISRQVHRFFVQTPEIEKKLKEISGFDIDTTLVPPPLPKIGFRRPKTIEREVINIVYAGKITPAWGVVELLDWTEKLRRKGHNVKLTVIANKISAPGAQGKEFRGLINKRFKGLGVYHIPGLPREEVLEHLATADFVWCYRPKELEESVLELSTKLVEAVACGARAINYPSNIHENLLGKDYPFFVSSFEDMETLIVNAQAIDSFDTSVVAEKVIKDHSMTTAVGEIKKVINSGTDFGEQKIVFAGHDRKFIDAYYSYLKSKGAQVRFDEWEWGNPGNEKRSKQFLSWADKVFCEWGLANAVWYSNHNTESKPLFVRIHLQEINPRAKKFGNRIAKANVTKFVVVSERVRQEAEKMFGWDNNKSIHIPNFVFDDEFTISEKRFVGKKEKIVLGMVGVVPQRKRFDRAVDLLLALRKKGYDTELVIKGPRPEEYDFMHSASRSSELDYYNACYDKIHSEPLIKGRVSFVPWGNDMPLWYEYVDYILSPSDFESFHYAVADGVLSGCHPLIWPWEESTRIYSKSWCVSSVEQAKSKIIELELLSEEKQNFQANREFIVSRYGCSNVYGKINNFLIGERR
uniref:glycosyltransferase family 4 protein n=1 Tax=uncultured Halomonas sp. TaxID=173971 RepID=UPI0026176B5E|nr:glycosyltransferase [uncultured Halomonas sp.]